MEIVILILILLGIVIGVIVNISNDKPKSKPKFRFGQEVKIKGDNNKYHIYSGIKHHYVTWNTKENSWYYMLNEKPGMRFSEDLIEPIKK